MLRNRLKLQAIDLLIADRTGERLRCRFQQPFRGVFPDGLRVRWYSPCGFSVLCRTTTELERIRWVELARMEVLLCNGPGF